MRYAFMATALSLPADTKEHHNRYKSFLRHNLSSEPIYFNIILPIFFDWNAHVLHI